MVPFFFFFSPLVTLPSISHIINCVLSVCTWHSLIVFPTSLLKCASRYTEIVWQYHINIWETWETESSCQPCLQKDSVRDGTTTKGFPVSQFSTSANSWYCLWGLDNFVFHTVPMCQFLFKTFWTIHHCRHHHQTYTHTNQSKFCEDFSKCFLYIL